jgi:POT family proton-dependent oligopeptide transporter
MERISSDLKHDRQTFVYAGARALERASFYGLRGIITLYMVRGPIGMSEQNAQIIYGAFIGSFVISQIMGALLGDLLIGNKKAMLIGGLLQAFAAFALCIPSTIALYCGLVGFALGTGLFSPNILSIYGKLFLNKLKLIDSGFTLFYVSVNLGSMIGIFALGLIGEFNYVLGFSIAGILMLISVAILFFDKKGNISIAEQSTVRLNKRIANIVIAILCLGIFWKMYEYGEYNIYLIGQQLQKGFSSDTQLNLLSPLSGLLIGSIACITWSFFYIPQLKKWAAGFLLAGASYGVALFISGLPSPGNLYIYVLSIFSLSFSEILIAPIFYSALTKNVNPRYLAIVIALSGIPSMIMRYTVNSNWNFFLEKFGLQFSAVVLGGIGVTILSYCLFRKKSVPIE